MAVAVPTPDTTSTGSSRTVPDEDRQLWKNRIQAGLADRRKYEPLWEECLAFAEGHQWITYASQYNRTLVTIPNPRRVQRVTNDELTQFRLTLQGELGLDDDRPQALFRQGEAPSEDYAEQANDALAYGWDEEWHGDEVLLDARRTVIDVGTAPVRCRFDPDYGEYLPEEQPFVDGRLVSVDEAMAAHRQGKRVELQRVRQGRIVWEAGTPFNTITPPRVHREHLFGWEIWVSVHALDELKRQYPHAAKELTADAVRSVARVTASDGRSSGVTDSYESDSDGGSNPADRQCFVYTCYERPTRQHPRGRVAVLGSSRMVGLEQRPSLDYRGPDKQWRPGVHYLHAIRLTDRFWSRGFMELGLSPQRVINTRLTQLNETINRGQAKVWLEEGSMKKMPEGHPVEVMWLKPGKPKPTIDQGIPPGPWMQADIEANRTNLERAVLPDVALGKNPPNVVTYSQLALLRELATRRLEPILNDHRAVIVALCEDSAWDIKRYWGPEKQIQVSGAEGELRAHTFNASAWPDYTKFAFAKGSALPRSQGAQLKLIEDLWQAALQSRAALADPGAWLAWYHGSLQAGKPLDLPLPPADPQREKAQYENEILTQEGITPEQAVSLVDYFDQHALHVIEHRVIQGHARLMGRPDVFLACEAHIREHERQATLNALEAAQSQQGPPQLPGGQPPDQGAAGQPARPGRPNGPQPPAAVQIHVGQPPGQ